MLICPEGDSRRRRHAHTACVLAARSRGELLLREEWQRTQPKGPSLWRRLLGRSDGPAAQPPWTFTRSGSTRMISRSSPGWRSGYSSTPMYFFASASMLASAPSLDGAVARPRTSTYS